MSRLSIFLGLLMVPALLHSQDKDSLRALSINCVPASLWEIRKGSPELNKAGKLKADSIFQALRKTEKVYRASTRRIEKKYDDLQYVNLGGVGHWVYPDSIESIFEGYNRFYREDFIHKVADRSLCDPALMPDSLAFDGAGEKSIIAFREESKKQAARVAMMVARRPQLEKQKARLSEDVRVALTKDLRMLARAQLQFFQRNGVFTRDVRRLRPNMTAFESSGSGGDPLIEVSLSNDADPYGRYREMAEMRLWTPGVNGCNIQAVAPDMVSPVVCDSGM